MRISIGTATYGIGNVIAVLLSVKLNYSVFWALVHFFLSWFYVFYAAIFRSSEVNAILRSAFG